MRKHNRNTNLTMLSLGAGLAAFGISAIAAPAYATENASAIISLASTQVVSGHTRYTYDLSLKNTSTTGTTIGTFWFSWIVGYSFLPSNPVSPITSPTEWENGPDSISVGADAGGGASIEWQATSSADNLAAGNTLTGFSFTTPDSLATLLGKNGISGDPILTSTVYSHGPFSDPGSQFVLAQAVPEPQPLALFAAGAAFLALLPARRCGLRRKGCPV